MEKYHPMSSLAPRDIVAKPSTRNPKNPATSTCCGCDASEKRFIVNRFPNIYHAAGVRLEMATDPFPLLRRALHLRRRGGRSFGRPPLPVLSPAAKCHCTGRTARTAASIPCWRPWFMRIASSQRSPKPSRTPTTTLRPSLLGFKPAPPKSDDGVVQQQLG
jgi:hypothetical protein